jgi:hypothetical protein
MAILWLLLLVAALVGFGMYLNRATARKRKHKHKGQ